MNVLESVLVLPVLPERIKRLNELAHNLWWVWTPEATELFATLDRELWDEVVHNPVKLLRRIRQERLEEVANDDKYLKHYDSVMEAFDAYMNADDTWFARNYPDDVDKPIAYFSAEFGLHESLPIYSGGLGVLSGDHCKAASDLGLPLVGVGFLYPQGYFRQRITSQGDQKAYYEKLDLAEVPARPAVDENGDQIYVSVELPGRTVSAKVWRIQVGRIPLYLLDTDVDPNAPEDRELAARLYGGDNEMRLSQEIILGIGGVRALRALEIEPYAWHMNEGHSAFIGLERIRELVEDEGLSFDEAREVVQASTLFTTHTPVPAGHDAFAFDLMERYFYAYWGRLGLNREEFLDLARHDMPWGPQFSMTVLALELSGFHNGVSELHGQVSREMWNSLWPELPEEEVPIDHITNGIHYPSWVSAELRELYDEYLGDGWRHRLSEKELWDAVDEIPDEKLWAVKQTLKEKMIDALRDRVATQRTRNREGERRVRDAGSVLDTNALTIGFARRFATYKRATLIFRDIERIRSIVADDERPVQLIFSGKAHPADEPGKGLIRQIYEIAQREEFKGRVLFVEDYDMHVARLMVQGVDVWLNNPRRPKEASGTSGMKAAINGAPNFSVLDGWWREGYNGENGWSIGEDTPYESEETQDAADAQSLYATLEDHIVPLFFERDDEEDIPHEWLEVAKNSIRSVTPAFNMQRMVTEYVERFYEPAIRAFLRYAEDEYAQAKSMAAWKQRVRDKWGQIEAHATRPAQAIVNVGEPLTLTATVQLGELEPDDVLVEAVYGYQHDGDLHSLKTTALTMVEDLSGGSYRYKGEVASSRSGRLAFGVRVLPQHDGLLNKYETKLVEWAK